MQSPEESKIDPRSASIMSDTNKSGGSSSKACPSAEKLLGK